MDSRNNNFHKQHGINQTLANDDHFCTPLSFAFNSLSPVVYGMNAVMTFMLNSVLITGLYKTRRNGKFSRNEKLVFILSNIDFVVALTQVINMMPFLKTQRCRQASFVELVHVFMATSSCSFVLLLSMERLITVNYNNKLCGIAIKDTYYIPVIAYIMLENVALSTWFFLAGKSVDFDFRRIFYFVMSTYSIVFLASVIVTNALLLLLLTPFCYCY